MAKDLDALAAQFGGVVVDPQQPNDNGGYGAVLNGLSPKDQADMKQKIYEAGVKRINDLREVTAKGAGVMSDLERFGQLNRGTNTGGLPSMLPDWSWLHPKDYIEMNSIQSKLGPNQRIQGSGSSSDRDVALFMAGLPNTSNNGNTNKDIRLDYQRQYNYALEKQKFLTDYLQNKGHLNGADAIWQATPQYKLFMQGKDPSLGNQELNVPKEAASASKSSPMIHGTYNQKTGRIE